MGKYFKFFLPGIILFAIVVRFVSINQSLWLDEAIGALVVKSQNYRQIITEFPLHDNHPPLYYLTLKLWSDIFGYSEVALRSLSVLMGVATIYVVYKISELLKIKPYWLSPLLLATSQIHIYYSQEARMYIMAAFLASCAFYFFLKEKWSLFSLCLTALVFTDYVPIFLLPVFWVIGFINKKPKEWWKNLVLSHLPLLVLGLLWFPIFLAQSQAGKWLLETLPAWKTVAGGATFKQALLVWTKFTFGRLSLEGKSLYYALVGIFSIPFVLALFRAWKEKSKATALWFYLLTPLFLGFVASFFFPAFIYFRLLYVLPAFYLLTALGISRFSKKVQLLLVLTVLTGNLVGWLIYIKDPYQQREDWRQAVSFVEKKAKEKEMVVFSFTEPFAPYRWYASGKVIAKGLTDSISANPEATRKKTLGETFEAKGVYYFEYLWELHDPQKVVESSLKDEGFNEVAAFDFPGVGIIRYLRRL
jgi:hypothetical protein